MRRIIFAPNTERQRWWFATPVCILPSIPVTKTTTTPHQDSYHPHQPKQSHLYMVPSRTRIDTTRIYSWVAYQTHKLEMNGMRIDFISLHVCWLSHSKSFRTKHSPLALPLILAHKWTTIFISNSSLAATPPVSARPRIVNLRCDDTDGHLCEMCVAALWLPICQFEEILTRILG